MAERFPSSQAGDFAVLEAGIVSEETYIEQGGYWARAYHPLIKYVLDTLQARPGARRRPGHRRGPAPVPRARDQEAAQRRAEPGLRRRRGQRHARRPRQAARGVHPRCLQGRRRDDAPGPGAHARPRPDDVRGLRPWLRAAVRGDRREQGARRPRPAVHAADVELPPGRPARRSARRRRASPAAHCRSTSTSPGATRRRRRRTATSSRSRPPTRRARSPRSRPPSSRCRTPTTGPATAIPRAGR